MPAIDWLAELANADHQHGTAETRPARARRVRADRRNSNNAGVMPLSPITAPEVDERDRLDS